MKNILRSVLLIFSSIALLSFFNLSSDKIINDIAASIRKGSANEVASKFATNVELLLPDNEGTYSRTQAEVMLRNFFNTNSPGSFSINHQGSSRDGSKYAIGMYVAKNGSKYRTYFLVKKVSNTYMIHQLQFEKQ